MAFGGLLSKCFAAFHIIISNFSWRWAKQQFFIATIFIRALLRNSSFEIIIKRLHPCECLDHVVFGIKSFGSENGFSVPFSGNTYIHQPLWTKSIDKKPKGIEIEGGVKQYVILICPTYLLVLRIREELSSKRIERVFCVLY